MLRKILLRGVAPLCAAAVLMFGTVGWIGSERALRPHYYHYQQSLASFPDLHEEPVRFHSSTGIDLVGRWFRGTNRSTIEVDLVDDETEISEIASEMLATSTCAQRPKASSLRPARRMARNAVMRSDGSVNDSGAPARVGRVGPS